MADPIVDIRGLRKSFDGIPVLSGVTLTITPGEILTILGGSGTGKSVLLKLMVGLLPPEAGEIRIDGQDIAPLPERELLTVRKKIGMVFQGAALFDSLTVAENVAFPLREHTALTEEEIAERVRGTLALVGLPGVEGRVPAELSGGMRKRVGIARAIALVPRILLYDEPTTGLDPSTVEKIITLIRDLRDKLAVTSVVVTHDLKSAFALSDRIALLHRGTIVFCGSPRAAEAAEHPVVRAFLAGEMEDQEPL